MGNFNFLGGGGGSGVIPNYNVPVTSPVTGLGGSGGMAGQFGGGFGGSGGFMPGGGMWA